MFVPNEVGSTSALVQYMKGEGPKYVCHEARGERAGGYEACGVEYRQTDSHSHSKL